MSTAQPPLSSGRAVFKGAFQGTIVYSVPLLGQRVVSIFLLSIVTRVLTTSDFGMLSLLDQVSYVLSVLLGGTFSTSLGYFYFQKNSESERGEVVGTVAGGALLLGCLSMVVWWPAMGILARNVFRSQEARRYLPLVLACMPAGFVMEALFGWLRVEDRQMTFAGLSLLRVALTAAGIVVLVGVLKMRVMAYLSTTLVSQGVVAICLGVYLFRYLRPAFLLSPVCEHVPLFNGRGVEFHSHVRHQLWRPVCLAPVSLLG